MKSREELNIEQFKIKFDVKRILEELNKNLYGEKTLNFIKKHLAEIKDELYL